MVVSGLSKILEKDLRGIPDFLIFFSVVPFVRIITQLHNFLNNVLGKLGLTLASLFLEKTFCINATVIESSKTDIIIANKFFKLSYFV